jgi:signal transduction histidine kinase
LKKSLQASDINVVVMLIIFVAVMIVALTIWGIIITHRVAGPLFIISRQLVDIAEGRYPKMRPLRKKDELHSFYATMNRMVSSLKQNEEDEINVITSIIDKIESTASTETLDTLKKLRSDKMKKIQ